MICQLLANGQTDPGKERALSIHGYVKEMQGNYFGDRVATLYGSQLLHNRLNLKWQINEHWNLRTELRNRVFTGELVSRTSSFGRIVNASDARFPLNELWVNERQLVVQSVIDRLQLQYRNEKWDIRVGRQRINWGMNTLWNPNDLFNTYNFLDFDYEERTGTDAVRIQKFMKHGSSLEVAYQPENKKHQDIGAINYRFNRKGYDVQLLAGKYHNDLVMGAGWAGNIRDNGFKGEVSFFKPVAAWGKSVESWSMSLQTDRTFADSWMVSAGWLYNSRASGFNYLVTGVYGTQLSPKSLFPFHHNLFAGINKSLSPIHQLSFNAVYSPTQHLTIFVPMVSWNAASNLDIDFTLQSIWWDVFGHYKVMNNAAFLRGRWSF